MASDRPGRLRVAKKLASKTSCSIWGCVREIDRHVDGGPVAMAGADLQVRSWLGMQHSPTGRERTGGCALSANKEADLRVAKTMECAVFMMPILGC